MFHKRLFCVTATQVDVPICVTEPFCRLQNTTDSFYFAVMGSIVWHIVANGMQMGFCKLGNVYFEFLLIPFEKIKCPTN